MYCKISGIVARAEAGWNTDTLAPTVNACLDSFGVDRVVFGGDWAGLYSWFELGTMDSGTQGNCRQSS